MTEDDAIAWHVKLGSDAANEETFRAFTAWLEANPANRVAFDRVENLSAELAAAAPAIESDLAGEMQGMRPQPAKIVPLYRPSRRVVAGLIGLAASVLIAIAIPWRSSTPVEYATGIGQTKTVSLADGTTVNLNTDTEITVDTAAGSRHVVLDHGEALFHVAKDRAHPFSVSVGDRLVRDIGTVFNVLRNEGTISVVVAEGEVAVSPRESGLAQNGKGEIRLAKGDELVYDESSAKTVQNRVDPSHALSWRDGYLVYENASLAKVVSDLNRYFTAKIKLENAAAAAKRFSGVLRIDSESAVLARLSQFLPVTARPQADGTVMLHLTGKED